VLCHPPFRDSEHAGCHVDADDRARRPDAVEEHREAQPGAAPDVQHGVAGLEWEQFDYPSAVSVEGAGTGVVRAGVALGCGRGERPGSADDVRDPLVQPVGSRRVGHGQRYVDAPWGLDPSILSAPRDCAYPHRRLVTILWPTYLSACPWHVADVH